MSVFQDILSQLRGGTLVTAPSGIVFAEKKLAAAGDYASGDVLNDIATSGRGALPWRFDDVARRKGGKATITKGIALLSVTALTPTIALDLYRRVPGCELVDNEAYDGVATADRLYYEGQIAFPAMTTTGTGGMSQSIATPSTSGNLPLRVRTDIGDTGLYGVPVITLAESGESANMTLAFILWCEQD